MNCKTQVVLAAGIGYLLGRQHKLRWGLLLAAAAASGRLSRPGALVEHGARALTSTPELGKLGEIGAPLVAATKDAARAAVSGRIASVSDRLRERTDALREPRDTEKGAKGRDREEEEPEQRGDERPARRRPKAAAEEADEYDTDDYEEEDEQDEEREPVTAGARPRGRPPVRRREG